jgi:hypothetical protein
LIVEKTAAVSGDKRGGGAGANGYQVQYPHPFMPVSFSGSQQGGVMSRKYRWTASFLFLIGLWACTATPASIAPTTAALLMELSESPMTVESTRTKTPTVTALPTETRPPVTAVPSPTRTAAEDIKMELGVVHFVIPAGLASGAALETTTREEWPYVNPSAGPLPEHWLITLEGYPLADSSFNPEIVIFHTDEYEQFSELTLGIITPLRTLRSHPDGPVPAGVFISRFNAHVYKLISSRGTGARYLTQVFLGGPEPVNNRGIVYYYAGLSADGGYFVSVWMPIHASFLPATGNLEDPLPAGGIPFPQNPDDASFGKYLQAVAAKINGTKPEEFLPSLVLLDSLVQSIEIG